MVIQDIQDEELDNLREKNNRYRISTADFHIKSQDNQQVEHSQALFESVDDVYKSPNQSHHKAVRVQSPSDLSLEKKNSSTG